MVIGNCTDTLKFQGIMSSDCFKLLYFHFRGSQKQYYDGAFIVPNEAVDEHLLKIGYAESQVIFLITCMCIACNVGIHSKGSH